MANEQDIEWSEEFCIGYGIVDNAHRKLFSVVKRLLLLTEQGGDTKSAYEDTKSAYIEGLKYLKTYVVEHFQQEEAYMRSINYPCYAYHKQLHDNLRDMTLPRLESNLEKTNYSKFAMEQFLGVCVSWLSGHIMVEDRAITGKTTTTSARPREQGKTIGEGLVLAIKDLFCQNASIVSKQYDGGNIGKTQSCHYTYAAPGGGHIYVLIALEEQLAYSAIMKMLNVTFKEAYRLASVALVLVLQEFMHSIRNYYHAGVDSYRLEKSGQVGSSAMRKLFRGVPPEYSILLETGVGRLAFCLKTEGGK